MANNRYFIGNFDGVAFTAVDDTVAANVTITSFIMDKTIFTNNKLSSLAIFTVDHDHN